MSTSAKKQTRVHRLRSIEENRMNALAVEFAQAQAKRLELQQHAAKIEAEISENSLSTHNIDAHLQSLAWLSTLQRRLQAVNAMVKDSEAVCDELRQQMIAQKVKVNGWEKLSQKMKSEADAEEEAAASMEADDRFLSQGPATSYRQRGIS